jgi:hypothetical protein
LRRKKGSNALRYAHYQAALIASARNNNFIRYFTNTLKGREKERGIKVKKTLGSRLHS